MFTVENIIGDIVFLSLRDTSFLTKLAISEQVSHFKVLGQDQLGLWVEHPAFQVPVIKDGKSSGEKNVNASMLIPWGFIASVVHFPGVEGFDFPNPFDAQIGFNIENK